MENDNKKGRKSEEMAQVDAGGGLPLELSSSLLLSAAPASPGGLLMYPENLKKKKSKLMIALSDSNGGVKAVALEKHQLEPYKAVLSVKDTIFEASGEIKGGKPCGVSAVTLYGDQLFVMRSPNHLQAYSKKGKPFFSVSTKATESIRGLHVDTPFFFTAGEFVLTAFHENQQIGLYMCPDKISCIAGFSEKELELGVKDVDNEEEIALAGEQVPPTEQLDEVYLCLGCQDRVLRLVRNLKLVQEAECEASLTCLHFDRKQRRFLFYGTRLGSVGGFEVVYRPRAPQLRRLFRLLPDSLRRIGSEDGTVEWSHSPVACLSFFKLAMCRTSNPNAEGADGEEAVDASHYLVVGHGDGVVEALRLEPKTASSGALIGFEPRWVASRRLRAPITSLIAMESVGVVLAQVLSGEVFLLHLLPSSRALPPPPDTQGLPSEKRKKRSKTKEEEASKEKKKVTLTTTVLPRPTVEQEGQQPFLSPPEPVPSDLGALAPPTSSPWAPAITLISEEGVRPSVTVAVQEEGKKDTTSTSPAPHPSKVGQSSTIKDLKEVISSFGRRSGDDGMDDAEDRQRREELQNKLIEEEREIEVLRKKVQSQRERLRDAMGNRTRRQVGQSICTSIPHSAPPPLAAVTPSFSAEVSWAPTMVGGASAGGGGVAYLRLTIEASKPLLCALLRVGSGSVGSKASVHWLGGRGTVLSLRSMMSAAQTVWEVTNLDAASAVALPAAAKGHRAFGLPDEHDATTTVGARCLEVLMPYAASPSVSPASQTSERRRSCTSSSSAVPAVTKHHVAEWSTATGTQSRGPFSRLMFRRPMEIEVTLVGALQPATAQLLRVPLAALPFFTFAGRTGETGAWQHPNFLEDIHLSHLLVTGEGLSTAGVWAWLSTLVDVHALSQESFVSEGLQCSSHHHNESPVEGEQQQQGDEKATTTRDVLGYLWEDRLHDQSLHVLVLPCLPTSNAGASKESCQVMFSADSLTTLHVVRDTVLHSAAARRCCLDIDNSRVHYHTAAGMLQRLEPRLKEVSRLCCDRLLWSGLREVIEEAVESAEHAGVDSDELSVKAYPSAVMSILQRGQSGKLEGADVDTKIEAEITYYHALVLAEYESLVQFKSHALSLGDPSKEEVMKRQKMVEEAACGPRGGNVAGLFALFFPKKELEAEKTLVEASEGSVVLSDARVREQEKWEKEAAETAAEEGSFSDLRGGEATQKELEAQAENAWKRAVIGRQALLPSDDSGGDEDVAVDWETKGMW